MDPIKDAFAKIKQDILALQEQIISLSQEIEILKRTQTSLNPTEREDKQSIQQQNPAIQQTPTDNLPLYSLKPSILSLSTGNGGVPTDRQTDSQTDQQAKKPIDFYSFHAEESPDSSQNMRKSDQTSQIQRVSDVLETLDSIKKEVRSNFKALTAQEMAVFSSIYALEEQGFVVDYSLISQKLSLSESSIRDYTHKLIRKGIPILKFKENNKKVSLAISPELKKIASLQAILALRRL